MSKHIRYAVETKKGYIKRRNSSNFVEVELDKADLYLSKHQAIMSAQRHGGNVVRIEVKELDK